MNNVGLNDRDIRLLKGMAEGRGVKELAADLGLSPKTVEYHLNGSDNPRSLAAKLGKTNKLEMVRFAVERGLVKKDIKPPEPVQRLQGVNGLAKAVMEAAARAAAGKADPIQVGALCQSVSAAIDLARLEFEAADRGVTLPEWLRD